MGPVAMQEEEDGRGGEEGDREEEEEELEGRVSLHLLLQGAEAR